MIALPSLKRYSMGSSMVIMWQHYHRSDCSAFPTACGSDNEDQSLAGLSNLFDDGRKVQTFKARDVGAYSSGGEADGTSLAKYVYTESVLLGGSEYLEDELLYSLLGHDFALGVFQVSVDA
jgi:hypothetical protein